MIRSKGKSLILVVAMLAVLLMGVAETQAGWRHWAYWGGPAYTCYAPCTSWYLGVRPGPIRRWAFGPYRWYRTGWGCGWGSCWGSCWGCYDPCCYSTCYTSYCCDPCCCGTVVSPAVPSGGDPTPTPAPSRSDAMPSTPSPNEPGPQTRTTLPGNSGLLTIVVPEEATVFVNGYQTKSTGALRQYVSNGLEPGLSYKYEVRAEMVRDGRLVEDTQVVYLTAGDSQRLAMSFGSNPEQRLATLW